MTTCRHCHATIRHFVRNLWHDSCALFPQYCRVDTAQLHEPALPDKADTNCNDLVRMEITVNGKFFRFKQNTVNTQEDLRVLKDQMLEIIETLDLRSLSSIGRD